MLTATARIMTGSKEQTESIPINPYDAKALRKRAWAYMLSQEYDKAIGDYTEALCVRPNDAVAHNGRGIAYLEKGLFNSQSNQGDDFDKAACACNQSPRIELGRAHGNACRGLCGVRRFQAGGEVAAEIDRTG
jgi:tetratricopeptide (TPR) repeat protein